MKEEIENFVFAQATFFTMAKIPPQDSRNIQSHTKVKLAIWPALVKVY
jgi:hypothetical protein